MRSTIRRLLVVLPILLVGCPTPNDDVMPVRDGDAAQFEAEVQPVLGRDCAYLGCHGREGISLTLYAVDYLRMIDPEGRADPDRPVLDERALSAGELEHNRLALAARRTADDPDAERFLRVLLPESEGGIPHADGTVVYESPSAPGYRTLRDFMETVDAR